MDGAGFTPRLQRKCTRPGCTPAVDDLDELLRKPVGGERVRHSTGLVVPATVGEVLQSAGRPLEDKTKRRMQARLGYDFGRVRIHDDRRAASSAAAVAARAYTVDNHVVFGGGEFRPGSQEGDRLLAHELTHVVQQYRSSALSGDRGTLEREAERTEAAFDGGREVAPIRGSGIFLARNGTGDTTEISRQADVAEGSCDIPALCRLAAHHDDIVPYSRVRAVYESCYPGRSTGMLSPCFSINMGLPGGIADVQPEPSATVSTDPPQAAESGSGLSLPSTEVSFSIGSSRVTVNLPSSLTWRLPTHYQGVESIVFELGASTDEFSFSASINDIPHVRISIQAGMTTEGVGSARVRVQSTQTVCRAQDLISARSALQSAGERLHAALQSARNTEPAADAGASGEFLPPVIRNGAEIIGAFAALNSAVDSAGAACSEVPVISAEFGVRGQVTESDEDETAAPTYLGGSLTWHF